MEERNGHSSLIQLSLGPVRESSFLIIIMAISSSVELFKNSNSSMGI